MIFRKMMACVLAAALLFEVVLPAGGGVKAADDGQSGTGIAPPIIDPLPEFTNERAFEVGGTAAPGSTVTVYYNRPGETPVATDAVEASGDGRFGMTLELSEGRYELAAAAELGGERSALSDKATVEVDLTEPDAYSMDIRWFNIAYNEVMLQWEPPYRVDEHGNYVPDASIDRYRLERRDGTLVTETADRQFFEAGLPEAAYVDYVFYAIDKAGNRSDPLPVHAATSHRYLTAIESGEEEVYTLPAISRDGGTAVYYSGHPDRDGIVVYDAAAGTKQVIGNLNKAYIDQGLAVSGDGRFVAYEDSNEDRTEISLYVYDRTNEVAVRVAAVASGRLYGLSLSDDGGKLLFESASGALTAGDANGLQDVFVADLSDWSDIRITRISEQADGGDLSQLSGAAAISGAGRYAAFVTAAPELAPGGASAGISRLYLYDTDTGETASVPIRNNDTENGEISIGAAAVSADGRYVAYTDKVAKQVGLYDRETGKHTVAWAENRNIGAYMGTPSLSDDGRYVAFDYRILNPTEAPLPIRSPFGAVRFDVQEGSFRQIGALRESTTQVGLSGDGSKAVYLRGESNYSGYGIYSVCFEACDEAPAEGIESVRWSVAEDRKVDGLLKWDTEVAIQAIGQRDLNVEAIVYYRTVTEGANGEAVPREAAVELIETAPGYYGAVFEVKEGMTQIDRIIAYPKDRADEARTAANLPVHVAGKLVVEIATDRADLLGAANLMFTVGGSSTLIPLESAVTRYERYLQPGEVRLAMASKTGGLLLASRDGVTVSSGSGTEVQLTPVFPASLKVQVDDQRTGMPLASIPVVFKEKDGGRIIHEGVTDASGAAVLPGEHYAGDEIVVSVLPERDYIPAGDQTVTLTLGPSVLRVPLRSLANTVLSFRIDYSQQAGSKKLMLPVLDSDAVVKVRSQPGLALKARIDYTEWISEEKTGPASRIIDLAERNAGEYEGVFLITEGIASIDSVLLQIDGNWLRAPYPVNKEIAGRFEVRLNVPARSVWHQELAGGALEASAIDYDWGNHWTSAAIDAESLTYRLNAPLPGVYTISSRPIKRENPPLSIKREAPPPGRTAIVTLSPEFAVRLLGSATGAGQYSYEVRDGSGNAVLSGSSYGALNATLTAVPDQELRVKLMPKDPAFIAEWIDLIVAGKELAFDTAFRRRPEAVVSGRVYALDGKPAAGSVVTATVALDGASKTYTANANAQGAYTLSLPEGEAVLRATGNHISGYASPRVTVLASGSEPAQADLHLKEQAKLNIRLYAKIDGGWQGPLEVDWSSGVHYRIKSTPAITNHGPPAIVEAVAGDTVRVCADGVEAKLPKACNETVIGEDGVGEVELRLENAGGQAQFRLVDSNGREVTSANASLYRNEDNSMTGHTLNMERGYSRFTLPVASTGSQRLIIRASSEFAIVEFHARPGDTAELGVIQLRKPGVFGDFTLNGLHASSEWTTPEGRLSLRAFYEHSQYNAKAATDAVLVLKLPEGVEILPGSAMLNGNPVAPVLNGTTVSVPLGDIAYRQKGAFQLKLKAGSSLAQPDLPIQASIRYKLGEEAQEAIIGMALLQVTPATIRAPQLTTKPDIEVSGTAPAGAEVIVYDGAAELGRTTASSFGTWSLPVVLVENARKKHRLRVGIVWQGEMLAGEGTTVAYDPSDPGLAEVAMRQTDGRLVTFRPDDGVAVFPYVVIPSYPFIFQMKFRSPERVYDVEVHLGDRSVSATRKGDGYEAVVPASYNLGPVWVTYRKKPDAVISETEEPTEDELRFIVPVAYEDFELQRAAAGGEQEPDGTVVPAGGVYADVSLSDDLDATVRASSSMIDSFTPSEAEQRRVERTGVPVYDVSVRRQWHNNSASMSVTVTIPRSELPSAKADGANEDAAGQRRLALLNAPAVKTTFEVGVTTVNQLLGARDVVVNAKGLDDDSNLFKRAKRAAQDARRLCDAQAREYYTSFAEEVRAMIAMQEAFKTAIGVAGTVKGAGLPGIGFWYITYEIGLHLDELAAEELDTLERYLKENKCKVKPYDPPVAEPSYIWDPSGFVYEGMMSNVLEGVKATALQQNADTGVWEIWDAEWYEQLNPHWTNGQGRYGWDVPPGRWKVKYEKEGYATTYSDELEVPPPHFDVNIGMESNLPPEVAYLEAVPGGGVLAGFTKPIDIQSLADDAITLTAAGGASVQGTVSPVDAETADGRTLAMAAEFTPDAALTDGALYTVVISGDIFSYAGVPLGDNVQHAVTAIVEDSTPPAPVSGLNGSLTGDNGAVLVWERPGDRDFAAVKLWWKKAEETSYSGEPLEIGRERQWAEATGLSPSADYDFQVIAVDAAGNESEPALLRLAGARDEVDVSPPLPVAGLKATATEARKVQLAWEEPSQPGEMSSASIVWTPDNNPALIRETQAVAGTRTAAIEGLEPSTDYTFAVSAVDGSGNVSSPMYLKVRTAAATDGGGGGGQSGGGSAPGGEPEPTPSEDAEEWQMDAEGGEYAAFDGSFVLKAGAGVFAEGTRLVVTRNPLGEPSASQRYKPVSDAYVIDTEDAVPAKPFRLALQYRSKPLGKADARKLGLYRKDAAAPGGWRYVGGIVDTRQRMVASTVAQPGEYAVMLYDRTFADLDNHWSRLDVEVLVSRHLVDGTSADRFAPDRAITRAEVVKLLVQHLLGNGGAEALVSDKGGSALFADVPAGAWFASYIAAGYELGLVKGAGGSFRPNDPVTREELAVLIVRFVQLLLESDAKSPDFAVLRRYADGDQVSGWAAEAVAISVGNGWVQGVSGTELAPKRQATRAQTAVMLLRVLTDIGAIEEKR
ncbi:hypothetical protein B1748_00225 [Paenibacillus sp. MY03]|uniref:S-layer homology domain-containing protein n=1 Tax=Paenibacillus sp. MY03 TaxID=302980 RepID=UPI000B3CAE0A|nr:S-layer homology domain-containing protein [Paenibacillus sp. MY03]OUS78541.1 hypothetical protein B1748_00225 [Paenibacillus sp. MY03]